MGYDRYSIWSILGLLGSGIIFTLFTGSLLILIWFFPAFLEETLQLPEIEDKNKPIFSIGLGVVFLVGVLMIFFGIRKRRKKKSQTKNDGEEWV